MQRHTRSHLRRSENVEKNDENQETQSQENVINPLDFEHKEGSGFKAIDVMSILQWEDQMDVGSMERSAHSSGTLSCHLHISQIADNYRFFLLLICIC